MAASLRTIGIACISVFLLLISPHLKGVNEKLTPPLADPVARFELSASSLCLINRDSLIITDISEGAVVYNYNFGSGAKPATADSAGPHKVFYETGGLKTITLKVENAEGDSATFSKIIFVYEEPSNAVVGPDTTVCMDTAALFALPPSTGVGKWELISGSGEFDDEFAPSTIVRGLELGENVFSWTITNGSCEPKAEEVTITREACGVSVHFDISTSSYCIDEDQFITVTDSSTGIASYQWSFGVGAVPRSGTGPGPFSVRYTSTGAKVMELIATDSFGTQYTRQKIILATSSPSPAVARPDTVICGDTILLSADPVFNGIGEWRLIEGEAEFQESIYTREQQVPGLRVGENRFEWRVGSNGCTDKVDTLLVRRDICLPPPSPEGISGPELVCEDTSGVKYWVSNLERTDIYNWSYPPAWDAVILEDSLLVTSFESGTGVVTFTAENQYGQSGVSLTTVRVESCVDFVVDSISAGRSSRGISVQWDMAFEKGVLFYTLERSLDGVLYQVLESVDAQGNETSPATYQQLDPSPIIGKGIYRVKITDRAGDISYTDTTSYTWEIPELLQLVEVSPNPLVNDKIEVSANFIRGVSGSIFVTNTLGSVIMEEPVSWTPGLNIREFDVTSLPPGIHFIWVSALGKQEVKVFKFIKLPTSE